jgi:hypothetical protein
MSALEWALPLALGLAFISVDEYAIADLMWTISAIVLVAKAIHYDGLKALPIWRKAIKGGFLVGVMLLFWLLTFWTNVKRGDRSWSVLAPRDELKLGKFATPPLPFGWDDKTPAPKLGMSKPPQKADVPPIPPTAALQFSLMTNELGKTGHVFPVTTASFREVSGVVTVPITLWAIGNVTAKDVTIILRICILCKYAEEPRVFLVAGTDPSSPDRKAHFDTIYPMGAVEEQVLKIKVGPNVPHFTIAGMYACDNCGSVVDADRSQKMEVYVVRP